MNSRLTVNLGMRTENEKIPSFRPDVQKYGIEFGFADKIAPRFGAAYDIRGDGRMKIFGSWGRYYDWTKYELARGTFGGDFWRIYYRGARHARPRIAERQQQAGPGSLGQRQRVFRDRRVPAFDTDRPGHQADEPGRPERRLGAPARARDMVFSATYVHNDLIRTIEDLGALVDGDEVYFYANPGEGIATETPTSGRTAPFPTPKPKRQYDALELVLNKRFSQRWFGGASYVLEPAVRQLRRHRRARMKSARRRPASAPPPRSSRTAAVPPRRQRQPRVGHRRAAVGQQRQSRRHGPPGDGSPARGEAVWRLRDPVRHAGRRVLLRRQRHADHAPTSTRSIRPR